MTPQDSGKPHHHHNNNISTTTTTTNLRANSKTPPRSKSGTTTTTNTAAPDEDEEDDDRNKHDLFLRVGRASPASSQKTPEATTTTMIKRRPLAPSFAQLPAAPPRIVFIDSPEAARLACARLREHRLLAVDMEGAPLGQLTTLIQFAPAGGGSDAVYVFDVLALGQTLFDAAHLLPILSDPNVLKLCYDCRGDAAALFFQHGVQVHGLYDLQV